MNEGHQDGRVEFFDSDTKVRVYGTSAILTFDIASGQRLTTTEVSSKLDLDRMFLPESIAMNPRTPTFAARIEHPDDGRFGLFDVVSGKAVWQKDFGRMPPSASLGLPSFPNYPTGYAFTPAGECLVVSTNREFTALDPLTGAELFAQPVSAGSSYLLFSPTGAHMIATGSCDVTVYTVPRVCGGAS